MSQPAASKALSQLEDLVGNALFDRSGTGTNPTALGVLLINHARSLVGAAQRMSDELDAVVHRSRQTLRIGILPSASIHITPQLIMALLARDDTLEITVTEGLLHELLARLSRHELDCVIGRPTRRDNTENIIGTFLYEDPVALVAGVKNRAVQQPGLSMEDVVRMPWILPVHDSVLSERIAEMFFRLGVSRPTQYVESNAVLTNVILINQHDWVVALPSSIAQYFEVQGRVQIIPIDTKSNIGNVEVMTRKNDVISPALALVLGILKELFPQSRSSTSVSR